MVGRMISCMIRLCMSRERLVEGDTVPIPPVFDPVSPSPTRLWSCTETIGTTRAPSEKTRNETSSPGRNSSRTSLAPAVPNFLSDIISATAACASALSSTTTTPLPAARPSTFSTSG